MGLTKLAIRGARQHNLKNISVEIPRNTLTVFTGLSRAGKPCDDRQGVARNLDADVFQVVLPRAPDCQFGQAHRAKALPPEIGRAPCRERVYFPLDIA